MAMNTKTNLLIANLQSQLTIAISTTQSFLGKHYFSGKFLDLEFFDEDK